MRTRYVFLISAAAGVEKGCAVEEGAGGSGRGAVGVGPWAWGRGHWAGSVGHCGAVWAQRSEARVCGSDSLVSLVFRDLATMIKRDDLS